MKRIVKSQEPVALRHWRETNSGIAENLHYNRGGWPGRAVKAALMREQGFLCAYTMRRIPTEQDCHVEHVMSQDQCREQWPEGDVDYSNIVACYPGKGSCPYGAIYKKSHSINQVNFVSPLCAEVEGRFKYSAEGGIKADALDEPARSTIQILNLDHPELVELRRAAISEAVLDADLDQADLQALADKFMEPNLNGEYAEFCLAISQVASQWPPHTS
jgi:uncharacterized protein (TIGR02646 family)